MGNFTELKDKLREAVLLVRCGDLDTSEAGKLIDDPKLLKLLGDVSQEIQLMPPLDLTHWPVEPNVEAGIFWLRGSALIAEYLVKRPLYRDKLFLPHLNVESVFTCIEALINDPILQEAEGIIDRIRLLRAAIRCLLFRIGEVYRFNDNTETELEQVISNLNRLSDFTDKVLEIDQYHSNYSLKAEIFYYRGRAERARGFYEEAEASFTECLKLARKRVERYEGDPGQADPTREYRHSSYLAARTLLQLGFLGYLQGKLLASRKLITASWFIVYHCQDRFTKAEIQFTTAAIRRALTTDKTKLNGLWKILREADETLGDLGHYQIQQMVKNELVLCRVYLTDFTDARKTCFEMSNLAVKTMSGLTRVKSYWVARAKKLLAITYIHQYQQEEQSNEDLVKDAIKFSGAAVNTLRDELPYCRHEIVIGLCIQAQAYIARFAKQQSRNSSQPKQKFADSAKADELLRKAEQLNRLVERSPGFGEMNHEHNRGVIALLRSLFALEMGDSLAAEDWLKKWDAELSQHVETQWLHDLAGKLKMRMPQQRKILEIDANRSFNDLCKDVAAGQYELVKYELKRSGQKDTNGEIARVMGISEATLRRYGVIKTERPYRKKKDT